MSWESDTDSLLSDRGTVVTVKSSTSAYTSSSVYPSSSLNIIGTSTVQIFPKRGAFKKEIKGRVVESTHLLFFPLTSSVAVGHWIFEPDETDYHDVMDVKNYDGHKQVYTEKVENR
jgi:hypothetical protein